MNTNLLQELVWQANIDDKFVAGLLNGQRATLLHRYALNAEAIRALLAIRADSLTEFAAGVQQLLRVGPAASGTAREIAELFSAPEETGPDRQSR